MQTLDRKANCSAASVLPAWVFQSLPWQLRGIGRAGRQGGRAGRTGRQSGQAGQETGRCRQRWQGGHAPPDVNPLHMSIAAVITAATSGDAAATSSHNRLCKCTLNFTGAMSEDMHRENGRAWRGSPWQVREAGLGWAWRVAGQAERWLAGKGPHMCPDHDTVLIPCAST